MKIYKIGALFCAVLMGVSCSDSNISEEKGDDSEQVIEVAPNEYIVQVNADSKGTEQASRAIGSDDGFSFEDGYDSKYIYMHAYNPESDEQGETVQFAITDGSFAYRVKDNGDGTAFISGNTETPIDESDSNTAKFNILEDEVYFSSWPGDVWECNMAKDEEGNDLELKFPNLENTSATTSYPIMWMQYRTEDYGSIEIYRSMSTSYSVGEMIPNNYGQGGLTSIIMRRIVGGYRETVIFTDLSERHDGAEYNYSIDALKWAELTDTEYNQWSMKVYLGNFPTTYNLKKNEAGSVLSYYESNGKNNGEYLTFYLNELKTGGAGPVNPGEPGEDNDLAYLGYGISTDESYLCTPVGMEETKSLNSRLLIKYTDNNRNSKVMLVSLQHNSIVPVQNHIHLIVSVFDVSELKEQFGIDENGNLPEGNAKSSRASRNTFMGYEVADIKPVKTFVY